MPNKVTRRKYFVTKLRFALDFMDGSALEKLM
jgi:hypothetical protein